jgi:TolB-like protein/Tfp pilus assembly protein PilF
MVEPPAGGAGAPEAGTQADAPLFISYASQDAAVAERLCAALEAAGLRCWVAPRDVRAGESYAAAIVQAINSCRMLVLLLSRSAVDSAHVLREVERASSKKRPILSVRLAEIALPPELEYFLSMNQWLDAAGGRIESVLPALIGAAGGAAGHAAVAAAPAAAVRPAAIRADAAPSRSARTLWLGAVLALALAGVFGVKWWLARQGGAAIAGAAGALTGAESAAATEKSVAVLPFSDLSEKKDQQYFADGLTEELIDRLARVPGLHVPARVSSFYFKGRQATLSEIAAALQVTHVLEGSVRKAGDEVRISAELVRVGGDSRIWSETFDRKIDDIFKAQDEIAAAVVKALQGSLLRTGAPSRAPTTNGEAYTTYLQGRAILRRGTAADYARTIEYYQRAVALDPTLAVAWAAIANTTADAYGTSHTELREPAATRAHAALERALALDPSSAAAYVALGRVAYFIDNDWETAGTALRRAIELDPGNAEAMRLSSYLAGTLGELDAQRQYAQQAITHDPLDYWNYFAAGVGAYNRGSFEECERYYRKAIELNDGAEGPHSELAMLLTARGQGAAALEEVKREPSVAWRALRLPIPLYALGRRREADAALAEAQARYGDTHPFWVAMIYAVRGDRDQAFAWLDRTVARRDLPPIYQRFDPLLKSLTGDARYREFLRQANLPQ